jgi:integrase/recombinase XerD
MKMQLLDIIPDFLIAKEVEEGCSLNTIKAYRYDLILLQKSIGDTELESIKVFHVRKVLKIFHERHYTKKAVARKIACYKSFFDFCLTNEIIEKNPMKVIKSPKIRAEESLPKFLSTDQMKKIFDVLYRENYSKIGQQRLKVIIPLLYSSMARISEICNLKIRDIDVKRNFIKVRGKGNKERYIPIDKRTMGSLERLIADRYIFNNVESDYLFVNSRGTPIQPRTIQRDLHDLKEILGFHEDIKITPHVFRHTGATHLRQNGMDISELQDILGHANPNTTRIYAKNDITKIKESYHNFHPLAQEFYTNEINGMNKRD